MVKNLKKNYTPHLQSNNLHKTPSKSSSPSDKSNKKDKDSKHKTILTIKKKKKNKKILLLPHLRIHQLNTHNNTKIKNQQNTHQQTQSKRIHQIPMQQHHRHLTH